MPDAHPSDRRPSVDSGTIEVTSEPVVLDQSASRDFGAVDITPTSDPDPAGSAAAPSRRRKIVLGSVLAVTLAGVAVFGSVGWRIFQQKDATLGTPTQVAGLTLDDSERARTTIDYLLTAYTAEFNADRSIGAVYADPAAAERSVLLFGGATLVWQPESDLDRLFELASEEDNAIAGIREVPAGALGGVMKCGTSSSQDGDLVFCGWADHGSVAMAMFPGRTVDESAALLRDIRAVVQTRD